MTAQRGISDAYGGSSKLLQDDPQDVDGTPAKRELPEGRFVRLSAAPLEQA
jgi:hypothetical protein